MDSIPPADIALWDAYRNTTYRVQAEGAAFELRVGRSHPEFDVWLRSRHATEWAFVTACNPRSQRLSSTENEARQERLLSRLAADGWRFLEGAGVGDDGAWPPERSVLIIGMPRAAAAALGTVFDQNAIVAGRCGEAAELVVCGR